MLIGAVAQSLPDIDFIGSFWMSTADDLIFHRSITHSILFAVSVAGLAGALPKVWKNARVMSSLAWMIFIGVELFTHIVLDAFNTYGTGWFEPFSHYRVSFNTLFVADPLFSIWPLLAFCVLLIQHSKSTSRKFWWRFGIMLSCFYLCYCIFNKIKIDKEVRQELLRQQISTNKYFTTPTALNNWLWYIVAGDSLGFYTGYRSVFDKNKRIAFTYFPKNEGLLKEVTNKKDLKQLIRFSQGFYTMEKRNDSLIFNDLRFGQILGWQDSSQKFVFHYFLQYPESNKVIVQRGRFAGWNKETMRTLWERIKGN
jgi:inner membrane protein